jgi:hypothetical protein
MTGASERATYGLFRPAERPMQASCRPNSSGSVSRLSAADAAERAHVGHRPSPLEAGRSTSGELRAALIEGAEFWSRLAKEHDEEAVNVEMPVPPSGPTHGQRVAQQQQHLALNLAL